MTSESNEPQFGQDGLTNFNAGTHHAGFPQVVGTPALTPAPAKSMIVAALLALFFGTIGLHNFYLGYKVRGAIQLCGSILGWATAIVIIGLFIIAVIGLWVFVEFIMILVRSGSYGRDSHGIPLR